MSKSRLDILEVLHEALHTPLGLIISTSSPELTMQHLYKHRNADPTFFPLSFSRSKVAPNQILIMRRQSDVET